MIPLKNVKIGLIGFGYWGKIILRNLRELGYNDIVICETQEINWHDVGAKYEQVTDYRDLQCDKVFVIVPVESHYEVCNHFLERGVEVFCEKPLCLNREQCENLYKTAEKNYCKIFVDWIFTFNPAVNKIKELTSVLGKPKNIIANRLNYGPARHDVNARWDLASHDVSIACYILDEAPIKSQWLDFKRNTESLQDDSAVGILQFEETNVQINVSWHYGMKDRVYIIEFENKFVRWDDSVSLMLCGNDIVPLEEGSPLHNAINCFLNGDYDQERLTYDITESLW